MNAGSDAEGETKGVLHRFPENSTTESESSKRASAQRLATAWKAEKMLSHIQETGYGRRTLNWKWTSLVEH